MNDLYVEHIVVETVDGRASIVKLLDSDGQTIGFLPCKSVAIEYRAHSVSEASFVLHGSRVTIRPKDD